MQTAKQALEHPKIGFWLSECRSKNTRRIYGSQIRQFLKAIDKTVDQFLNLPQNEKRHLMLIFQNQCAKANTANSTLGAVNSFLETVNMKVSLKGKRRRKQLDLDSHQFSNGDLSKMFKVANVKEKALLSLACSLGWEISSILEFPREQLQSYFDRATAEGKQYYYFLGQRPKTGALRLGVLNPLALEWVGKWLRLSKDANLKKRKANKRTKDRPVSDVFDMTPEGVNVLLRRISRKAQIHTNGRVHFHKLRGWVMSGLSRAGFNEWQTKFLLGKAIPASDMTYLYGLQQQIEERYPEAFENYLNLETPVKAVTELSKSLEEKTAEIEELKAKVERIEGSKESLALLLQKVLELEKKLNEQKTG